MQGIRRFWGALARAGQCSGAVEFGGLGKRLLHTEVPRKEIGGAAARQYASQPAAAVAAALPAEGVAWQAELVKARRLAWPAGAIAGIVGSVAGAGGATVIAPIVSRYCQSIPQRILAGTSVAAVLATASASTATFAAAGCIDLPAALLLTLPAVALAPLGARCTSRLNCTSLKRLLGYFLLAAAPLIPLKAYMFSSLGQRQASTQQGIASRDDGGTEVEAGARTLAAGVAAPAGQEQQVTAPAPASSSDGSIGSWLAHLGAPKAAVLLATGGLAGFASGLLGVAPGVIIIPTVALVMPYAQATVLGTSLLAVIPPSAVALLQHHRLGNVDWRMAAALAVSSLVGAAAGSQAAVHAPPGVLEGVFTGALLVLARATLRSVR